MVAGRPNQTDSLLCSSTRKTITCCNMRYTELESRIGQHSEVISHKVQRMQTRIARYTRPPRHWHSHQPHSQSARCHRFCCRCCQPAYQSSQPGRRQRLVMALVMWRMRIVLVAAHTSGGGGRWQLPMPRRPMPEGAGVPPHLPCHTRRQRRHCKHTRSTQSDAGEAPPASSSRFILIFAVRASYRFHPGPETSAGHSAEE